jgi:hypothetical protein
MPASARGRLDAGLRLIDATRHGHITKQGSRWLRWMLVETATSAVRDPQLGRFTTQITRRRGPKIAPGTAWTLLVRGAGQVLRSNADLATETLVLAIWAALAANQLDRSMEEIGPPNSRLPGQDDVRVKPVADSLFAFGLGGAAPADAIQQLPREPPRAEHRLAASGVDLDVANAGGRRADARPTSAPPRRASSGWAPPWAEPSRAGLRASGEPARRRDPFEQTGRTSESGRGPEPPWD